MTGRVAARAGKARAAFAVVCLVLATLPGCKFVRIDEDRALRARRGGSLDAGAYVDAMWTGRALPELARRTVDATTLLTDMGKGLDRAGTRFGRRTGEGAPWTFVVAGQGRVAAVDRASRQGTATIALGAGAPAMTLARTVVLQIGPVVPGAAIRDALPFLSFNDFADQLAFADVGRALTARAMRGVAAPLRSLRVGERIVFSGVANVRSPDDPLVLTPFAIDGAAAGVR